MSERRESRGVVAPNASKKARGAEHRKRHAVLMCSCGAPRFTISPTLHVRAVAVNRDRQQTALTREWRENEPPRITDPHPAPSSARPRCTELRRSEQGQAGDSTQLAGSTADRPAWASGVIAFTIRRAVCRCHLLSPRAAPTRRSDDQSTACPALPMPSRAAGRSPRREEPVEEVLIRLFAPWPRWRASAAF